MNIHDKPFCEHICLFLLSNYLVVEWVGYMVSMYLAFLEIAKLFLKVVGHFAFSLAVCKSPLCSTSSPSTMLGCFNLVPLTGVK